MMNDKLPTYTDGIRKWCDGRLSTRPAYYSGRDPSTGDLGPKHLKMLHDGIAKDVGPDNAKQFIDFVYAIADLAATPFLIAYERFVGEGYTFDPQADYQSDGDRIDIEKDEDGRHTEVSAMATMASMMFGSSPEVRCAKSMQIKGDFLRTMDDTRSDSVRPNIFGPYGVQWRDAPANEKE